MAQAGAEPIAEDVWLLRGLADAGPLRAAIDAVAADAPFQQLRTRTGRMSVALTNCGSWGWHSDERGYRYVDRNPASGRSWPKMPALFLDLARRAAHLAGFQPFAPDCCLINRYAVGARMGTHRDFDELDLRHPIVSVSIGLPATFLWFGAKRTGTPRKVPLADGDVMVWGASARAGYHGVCRVDAPAGAGVVAGGAYAAGEPVRFNLTFRRAR